jgi:hypothetical protein
VRVDHGVRLPDHGVHRIAEEFCKSYVGTILRIVALGLLGAERGELGFAGPVGKVESSTSALASVCTPPLDLLTMARSSG